MDCKKTISLIHEYFDGDLAESALGELKVHLDQCSDCKRKFYRLEKTEALLRSMSDTEEPYSRLEEAKAEQITAKVLSSIPPPMEKKRANKWVAWARRHPAVAAGFVFLLIMLGSLFSMWEPNTQLVVKGSDIDQLIIEGNKVIVPDGRIVGGNLVVQNGEIQVDGEIRGDLVVIDGSIQQASTAKITGEVNSINQTLDRMFYHVREWFSSIFNSGE